MDNVLDQINTLVAPFNLVASYLGEVKSVGVGGDNRSYTRAIVLSGPFPGWDILEKLSSQIGNTMPINRVTYEIK